MSLKDHKEKRLTKKQLEVANILRYMDERMLSLVEQIRAVAIAGKISPEDFQKAFVDQKAQDEFYVKLHVAEDNYELQEKAKIAAEDAKLGKSPSGIPPKEEIDSGSFGDGTNFEKFAPPDTAPAPTEPENMQSEQSEPPVQTDRN